MKYLLGAGAAVIVLGCGVWAVAGPYTPGQRSIADEAFSLAGLNRFNVEVRSPHMPEMINPVLKVLSERLQDAGCELSEDLDVPRMVISIFISKDPNQPEALAVLIVIAVRQPVSIERLQTELTIPTALYTHVKLTTKAKARTVIIQQARKFADFAIETMREATEMWQRNREKSLPDGGNESLSQ